MVSWGFGLSPGSELKAASGSQQRPLLATAASCTRSLLAVASKSALLLAGTKFGAMLDMLTDRCATMCLLVNLSLLYPSYTFLFQLNMTLDIASHWLHLHR